jgi:hypothetical protein
VSQELSSGGTDESGPTPTTTPTPSGTETKIHWNEQEAKDESGKAFKVAVPDAFTLQSPNGKEFIPAGQTNFKNAAGDEFRFSASPANAPTGDIKMQLSFLKDNAFATKVDLGPYTVYETSMDLSSARQTSGTPIHIPHSTFTGLIVPKSNDKMAYLVNYTSDAKLSDAKAVADGACRWIAAHN